MTKLQQRLTRLCARRSGSRSGSVARGRTGLRRRLRSDRTAGAHLRDRAGRAGAQYYWVGGYWRWNGYRYVWVRGHYAVRPTAEPFGMPATGRTRAAAGTGVRVTGVALTKQKPAVSW